MAYACWPVGDPMCFLLSNLMPNSTWLLVFLKLERTIIMKLSCSTDDTTKAIKS